jgi:hypothetical protein
MSTDQPDAPVRLEVTVKGQAFLLTLDEVDALYESLSRFLGRGLTNPGPPIRQAPWHSDVVCDTPCNCPHQSVLPSQSGPWEWEYK